MEEKEALFEKEFCLICTPSVITTLPSLLLLTITESTGHSEAENHCGQTAEVRNQATGQEALQWHMDDETGFSSRKILTRIHVYDEVLTGLI